MPVFTMPALVMAALVHPLLHLLLGGIEFGLADCAVFVGIHTVKHLVSPRRCRHFLLRDQAVAVFVHPFEHLGCTVGFALGHHRVMGDGHFLGREAAVFVGVSLGKARGLKSLDLDLGDLTILVGIHRGKVEHRAGTTRHALGAHAAVLGIGRSPHQHGSHDQSRTGKFIL